MNQRPIPPSAISCSEPACLPLGDAQLPPGHRQLEASTLEANLTIDINTEIGKMNKLLRATAESLGVNRTQEVHRPSRRQPLSRPRAGRAA